LPCTCLQAADGAGSAKKRAKGGESAPKPQPKGEAAAEPKPTPPRAAPAKRKSAPKAAEVSACERCVLAASLGAAARQAARRSTHLRKHWKR